jgi:uncharacterized membrane protein
MSQAQPTVKSGSETARVEAFSDGVLAIAITLLVLDIKVPVLAPGQTLMVGLLRQWPQILGYAASFFVIGIYWANHHYMFNLIHRCDHWLLLLNLGFLLCIGSLPFPTALVSAYLQNPEAQRPAVFVYQGAILACAVFFNAIWRYASTAHRLIDSRLDPEFIDAVTRRYNLGVLTYVISVFAALWNVRAALAIDMFLVLVFFFPSPKPQFRPNSATET